MKDNKNLNEKICSKCGRPKLPADFNKRPETKDGLRSECKECQSALNKVRYSANADHRRAKQREWNLANKDKKKRAGRKWYLKNPEKVKLSREKWEKANPEKVRERIAKWARENPEKVRAKSSRWREKNPEKAKDVARRGSNKIWNSQMGRLNGIISSAIRRTLKGGKSRRHWESIVGYNIGQLKSHLEKQFLPEMTWKNHGSLWEIDHKIPVAAFNFANPEDIDFKKCWALDNLQPLTKLDNRHKSAKIPTIFQPSLAISI